MMGVRGVRGALRAQGRAGKGAGAQLTAAASPWQGPATGGRGKPRAAERSGGGAAAAKARAAPAPARLASYLGVGCRRLAVGRGAPAAAREACAPWTEASTSCRWRPAAAARGGEGTASRRRGVSAVARGGGGKAGGGGDGGDAAGADGADAGGVSSRRSGMGFGFKDGKFEPVKQSDTMRALSELSNQEGRTSNANNLVLDGEMTFDQLDEKVNVYPQVRRRARPVGGPRCPPAENGRADL